jgi:hypothetical protein
LDRDDGRYVEAHEFLSWLSGYVEINQTDSTIRFPDQLANAVRGAANRPGQQSPDPLGFDSLTLALEDWFAKPLAELPDGVRRRVRKEFGLEPWDELSPGQRQSGALQSDYQADPSTEQEREYWWNFYARRRTFLQQIEQWTQVETRSASDLGLKETRLSELNRELARMELEASRVPQGQYFPARPLPPGGIAPGSVRGAGDTRSRLDRANPAGEAAQDEQTQLPVGSLERRRQIARNAANARHDQPGGSRDRQKQIQQLWASGKYSSREVCAEQECGALGMSYVAARRALRNTPDPDRSQGTG